MPVFEVGKLEKECSRVFEGAGLSNEEAQRVAHSLILANLMGHDSHGVIRIPMYVERIQEGLFQAGQKIQLIREADASAVVDGGQGFGQTVCMQAMQLAMKKAKARSIGAVELFNCSHIGRLGEYVELAAANDMIGIVMCNNGGGGQLQAPYGGIDPRMSPNPVAVGIPTGKEFPIVVDMTSSVVAEGKIRVKKNRDERLPEGWAIDSEGKPTTDPNAFYGPPRGAILPFGGIVAHKGYALSVVIDVLSGALGGAGCSRAGAESGGGNGVFILAIDIGAFTGRDRDRFRKEMDTFVDWLKSSRLMPGFKEILIPGEVEYRMRSQKENEGVFVEDETWQQIRETGEKVGVKVIG